ncbi:hypothetical protein ABFT51_07345 [Paenibacillus peoriae]|uniref:hypothetical protein n=1 Tax=Paenibacillus peoriae TaxID=59893 RepID=UPI0032AF8304
MKLLKFFVILTLVLVCTNLVAPSSFADSNYDPNKTSSVSESVKLTPEEIEVLKANATVENDFVSEPQSQLDRVTLSDVNTFDYSFSQLGSQREVKSYGTIDTSAKTDVYCTLTQKTALSNYSAYVMYLLENTETGKRTPGKPVRGNVSETVGWSDVLPGNYRLVIVNMGEHETEGSGFVRAY